MMLAPLFGKNVSDVYLPDSPSLIGSTYTVNWILSGVYEAHKKKSSTCRRPFTHVVRNCPFVLGRDFASVTFYGRISDNCSDRPVTFHARASSDDRYLCSWVHSGNCADSCQGNAATTRDRTKRYVKTDNPDIYGFGLCCSSN